MEYLDQVIHFLVIFSLNEKKDNKQCLSDTPRWSRKKINIKNTKAIQND